MNNWKLGGKNGWPYGAGDGETQRRLLSWCNEEHMAWVSGYNCFHYLTRTSHNRFGVYEACGRWTTYSWMDHVSCWNNFGDRYLVSQPYIEPDKYRSEIEAIAKFNGWQATILDSGWYGHGACFIAFGPRQIKTGG